MLVLHLVPYRIRCLYALLDLVFYAHAVECVLDGRSELREQLVAVLTSQLKFRFYLVVLVGVLKLKAQVLQLGLDLIQSQTVGQRCIYI